MTAPPAKHRPAALGRRRDDEEARREARLAAALRANLKKRKDQQRERGIADTPAEKLSPAGDPETDVC